MEDHSSPPKDSKILQHNGSSSIKHPLPTIPRKAEATVKLMKIIHTVWNGRFLEGHKLCKALLQYHNTPSSCEELSQAQKLYGCPVQDTLPANPKSFDSQQQDNLEEAAKKREGPNRQLLFNITAEQHIPCQNSMQALK